MEFYKYHTQKKKKPFGVGKCVLILLQALALASCKDKTMKHRHICQCTNRKQNVFKRWESKYIHADARAAPCGEIRIRRGLEDCSTGEDCGREREYLCIPSSHGQGKMLAHLMGGGGREWHHYKREATWEFLWNFLKFHVELISIFTLFTFGSQWSRYILGKRAFRWTNRRTYLVACLFIPHHFVRQYLRRRGKAEEKWWKEVNSTPT